jgi:hypothetical protein
MLGVSREAWQSSPETVVIPVDGGAVMASICGGGRETPNFDGDVLIDAEPRPWPAVVGP